MKPPPAGIAFHIGSNDHETSTLALWCNAYKVPYRQFRKAKDVPAGWMPSGTVPWVESVLGRTVVPDYFPGFLNGWVKRTTWHTSKWPLRKCFIKPADQHKRFTGFVTSGTYKGKKKGPFVCSEVVKFTNEWRYYITAGQIVAGKWYWGDDVNTPDAPELSIPFPDTFYGTADFGTYSDGQLALIECHPAFACGWYGPLSEYETYANWLVAGWQNLTHP